LHGKWLLRGKRDCNIKGGKLRGGFNNKKEKEWGTGPKDNWTKGGKTVHIC